MTAGPSIRAADSGVTKACGGKFVREGSQRRM
jgi:hypothetical protein